jgi:pyruvate/2-oxoglutarate dehydrogenase complex dihydrolipoamide dehydrogenase (E3) component
MMSSLERVSSAQRPTNSEPEEFDILILGSGVGTKVAAWTFAQEGKRVAAVERKYIGGACPNIACLPSKNIIHSAKVASYVRASAAFGISTNGFSIDMSGVRARKRAMVSDLIEIHRAEYHKSGAELIMGEGRFIGPRTVEVALNDGGCRVLRGVNVIIGTGSRAALDPIPGLAEAQPLTHVEALELGELPGHLLVIGGGYVGLELSQAARRFGSQVTILEHKERLVHFEDDDVTEALQKLFQDEGISVLVNARIKRVSGQSGQSVKLVVEHAGVEKTLEGTHLLAASGRLPNTENMGLDRAGVELRKDGYIQVDERLQTTAPGVWAVGDVTGGPKFTHISFDDFRVIYDNLNGRNRVTTGRQVPFCLFTDPEVARIGLSEKEARAQGIAYRVFKMPVEEILRARTLGETRGFVKALVEADGDRILGFTAFAPEAGEIMSAVQIAIIAGLPYTKLRDAIFSHPTMMEGLNPLFASAPVAGRSANA